MLTYIWSFRFISLSISYLLNSKEAYIANSRHHYVPIFFRDWYLDAVCDVPWNVQNLIKNGDIVASYVYMRKSKFGLSYIINPQLCPYTGPLFYSSEAASNWNELKALVPTSSYVEQSFWPVSIPENDEDVTSEKYTFRIAHDTDTEILKSKLSTDYRRKIRKAEKELKYEVIDDFEKLLSFAVQSFDRKTTDFPYDESICRKMDAAVLENGERKIVQCTDEKGEVVAMAYFLVDEKWTYNLINAVTATYNHNGMNLIIWREIETSIVEGRGFDFEGSMVPGVEEFYKRFGGEKTYYPSIRKAKNKIVEQLVSWKKK